MSKEWNANRQYNLTDRATFVGDTPQSWNRCWVDSDTTWQWKECESNHISVIFFSPNQSNTHLKAVSKMIKYINLQSSIQHLSSEVSPFHTSTKHSYQANHQNLTNTTATDRNHTHFLTKISCPQQSEAKVNENKGPSSTVMAPSPNNKITYIYTSMSCVVTLHHLSSLLI